jgi:uncharacterized protein (DUF302 family)
MNAKAELDRRGAIGLLGLLGLAGLGLSACGSDDAAAETGVDPAAIRHSATRVSVTGLRYEQLVRRFERTVPQLPVAQMQAKLQQGDMDGVRTLLQNASPVRMFLFYALDVTPFMAAAGHSGKAKTFLMGNPLIAERMFAHDPGVMLYAPLRVLIHTDAEDVAHLVFDRPSELFASFDSPEIAATGAELDATLADLIRTLKLEVPASLTA